MLSGQEFGVGVVSAVDAPFDRLKRLSLWIRRTEMVHRKADDEYPQEEAQRRFERLVQTALNTPPKHMKDRGESKPRKPSSRALKKSLAVWVGA